ncbi:CAMK family protein kinase [Histomonas meleagridis]|uniref:CAMK family protein kinase n=1 Tax=Histomonas meleagridis TaxID=135588 RepID=UPI00355A94C6|nr:CAMK family protein kinase [Histomonas meleagridis]
MLERGKNIKSNAGSHQFMAPEIISSVEYDPFLADVWSLGITFYVIAFGKLPWTYHNVEELDVAIKSGIFTFPSYADREFCMLIRAMTNVNPLKREPLAKLINYPVFKNITKYSYASMSHKKVGNIITNKRSEIEVPSSVSHGTILCNRTNNKLYLLKKQELKRNIKVVRTFAD